MYAPFEKLMIPQGAHGPRSVHSGCFRLFQKVIIEGLSVGLAGTLCTVYVVYGNGRVTDR